VSRFEVSTLSDELDSVIIADIEHENRVKKNKFARLVLEHTDFWNRGLDRRLLSMRHFFDISRRAHHVLRAEHSHADDLDPPCRHLLSSAKL
jgi:hypothetical protein